MAASSSRPPLDTTKSFETWRSEQAQWNLEEKKKTPDVDQIRDAHITRTLPDYKSEYTPEDHIRARLLWSETLQEIDQLNQKNSALNKATVKARLEKLGFRNADIVEKCIGYLQNQVVMPCFNATFLAEEKTFQSFQLNNMFLKASSRSSGYINTESYKKYRNETEHALFSHVPHGLTLLNTPLARPRYGLLSLEQKGVAVPVSGYGNSFLILSNCAKLNCFFVPSDSYNYCSDTGKNYLLATFAHLEVLLLQCSDNKLKYIAQCATGQPRTSVYYLHWTPNIMREDYYIEVLLYPVNALDAKQIQHIHIAKSDFNVPRATLNHLKRMGLSISNSNKHRYTLPKVKPLSARTLPRSAASAARYLSSINYDTLHKSFLNAIANYKTNNIQRIKSIDAATNLFVQLSLPGPENTKIILGFLIRERNAANRSHTPKFYKKTSEYADCIQKILNTFQIQRVEEIMCIEAYNNHLAASSASLTL
jgi:hypothetical protein